MSRMKVLPMMEFTRLQQRFIKELCYPQWLMRTHKAICEALNEEHKEMQLVLPENEADLLDKEEKPAEAYETLKKLGVIQEISVQTPDGVQVLYKLKWRDA